MCVCKIADLPGYSVATTNKCMMKLEGFDEISTHEISNFENNFSEMVFQLLEEISNY